jgi:ribosomal protein S27E
MQDTQSRIFVPCPDCGSATELPRDGSPRARCHECGFALVSDAGASQLSSV